MTTRMTGGEAAVLSLHNLGVETVFGLPGVQNDWLYNAFYDHRDKFRIIHTRHEQGAAYMALGSALATGETSVFNVVPGPGILNASAALSTAYATNAKVMCLTGQIPSHKIDRGMGDLHEINDQLGILKRLTKWAERASSPAEIPGRIKEAFAQTGFGRPRPTALEIPMDVLAAQGPVDLDAGDVAPKQPPLDEEGLNQAAEMLAGAENVMIFVGSGAMDASEAVRQLTEKLQAPVVAFRNGHGVVDSRSPHGFHMPAARPLWAKTDVVLAIGSQMRIPMEKWTQSHRPKIIRIDVDPVSHTVFSRPELAITSRAEEAVPFLLERLEGYRRSSRIEELQEAKAAWTKKSAVLEPQQTTLRIIREELGEDGIFVDELTQVGFASRFAYQSYKPRTFISTGYQGTLGYGFPTALGVKVVRPDVPVISITGDGGFMFGVQELATAVQHKIPLVTILFNNNQFGNVQQMQKNDYGGRIIATDLVNPDFPRMIESFGAQALQATDATELRAAIRRGLATTDGPTVIEVPFEEMPSIDQFR
ncbi:thiamine pyrophosphate-dependent enzyme [Ruegeria arenilitoris]|uniref:thiamine pyrophosphate-dependent enzyme n=1 Tax=Ruegeria arenilitoris TaxID=1173585 RepID=UPI001C2B7A76|nr:thiamine pyrophosphate-dependent enzyme [Ruegeria arenilitoris]